MGQSYLKNAALLTGADVLLRLAGMGLRIYLAVSYTHLDVYKRQDQAHAGGAVAGLGDPRVHLGTGQVAALAGLCACLLYTSRCV